MSARDKPRPEKICLRSTTSGSASISAEIAMTVHAGDDGRSFRGWYAGGLRHADHDPAYGNGGELRHCFPSSRRLCERRHGRESPSPRRNAGRTSPSTPLLAWSRSILQSVVFDVEAWDGDRKIGDGTHRRGVVNVVEFEELRREAARHERGLSYPNPAGPSRPTLPLADIVLIRTGSP